MKTVSISTLILVAAFSLSTYGAAESDGHRQVGERPGFFQFVWETSKFYLSNRWKTKEVFEEKPNLKSNYEFLLEKRSQNNSGKMTSYFDKELQTRIYFSATAKPNSDGTVPVVDSMSKGLVIYFHGSGTENGSGANFNYKGNKLSTLGYSSVSMDYPFHRDGPINSKFGSAKHYSEYILKLINKFRIENKPVILVGHSFGVNIIAEFITRYPFAANAVVLLSPAGFNDELATWAKEKTSVMLKTFPHFSYNEMGARWAGFINRQFNWNKINGRERRDPTLINPKLKVRIVSGEWEEFIPGPLDENGLPKKEPRTYDVLAEMKKFFRMATTVLEPGVGHLIHSHTDANGQDLILREILAANDEKISEYKEITDTVSKERKKILSEIDQAIHKQRLEPFFLEWLAGTYGKDYITNLFTLNDENGTSLVRRVLNDFKKFEEWRTFKILISLKDFNHPFYVDNKEHIDSAIGSKNLNDRTKLVNAYYIFLVEHVNHQRTDVLAGNPVQEWITETGWNLQDRVRIDAPPARIDKKSAPKGNLKNQCLVFYNSAS